MVSPSSRSRRLPLIAAGAVLLVLALVAAIVLWPLRHGDGREQAQQLVAALADGDFTGIALVGGGAQAASEQREEILGDLLDAGGADPVVELSDPGSQDEGRRTATYTWSWELPGDAGTWTYDTSAFLERTEDGWAAQLEPATFAPDLVEGERLEVRAESAEIGSVLDRDGTELFGPREVGVIGLDKTQVEEEDQETSARDLAEALRIDPDNLVSAVESAGPEAFVAALTVRAEQLGDYPLEEAAEIPGYRVLEEQRPLAIERTYAPGVLGSLREATQEDIEESEGELVAGDLVAGGGVVGARQEQLLGVPGIRVVAAGAEDAEARTLHEVDPEAGTDVSTTLDDELQREVTRLVADQDSPSAVIALQPSTGDVLAAATGPTGQEFPVGLQGRYAPGSSFKPVTALGLLREGLTPETMLECPATATVEGRSFKNADSLSPSLVGPMDLRGVIAHSCNTALLLEHDTVDQPALAQAAGSLGLGQEPVEGLDAFLGAVDPEDEGTEHAAAMIGQGRVLTSPLSMAVVMASIQEGRAVVPRILQDTEEGASAPVEAELTEEETVQLQGLLRGVVTDGSLEALADVPGDPVLGKTGTAEWVDDEGELRLHSWVIVAQGDLAVAVFMEDGSYGSVTAGPVAREVLEAARG